MQVSIKNIVNWCLFDARELELDGSGCGDKKVGAVKAGWSATESSLIKDSAYIGKKMRKPFD